jgi:RNA polymerase sigma-70 factor (ECF subfamily)
MTEKPHAPLEDTAIIRLYNARDERAISETDRKYGSYCMAVSMNILDSHPDAEECVNDTYLQTWRAIPPQNPPSLRNFLGKIIRNLSITRWRALHSQKRDRDLTVALSELEECLSVPAETEGQELCEWLNGFLEGLDKTERVIFVGRYWYAHPVNRLAEAYGMTPNAVTKQLARTRERLRAYLAERGYTV